MTTKTLSPEAAKAKPKDRWRAALRLTDQPFADAEGRLTPDAELRNLLRALWRTASLPY